METELVNPPKNETKMIAPQKKGQKTYKVLALQPFNIGKVQYENGAVIKDHTRIVQKGEIVEVDKEQARDLCKKIYGPFSFSGERYNADTGAVTRHDLTRARLATPADLVDKKPITPLEEEDIFQD